MITAAAAVAGIYILSIYYKLWKIDHKIFMETTTGHAPS